MECSFPTLAFRTDAKQDGIKNDGNNGTSTKTS